MYSGGPQNGNEVFDPAEAFGGHCTRKRQVIMLSIVDLIRTPCNLT